jgi:hypothetical protein
MIKVVPKRAGRIGCIRNPDVPYVPYISPQGVFQNGSMPGKGGVVCSAEVCHIGMQMVS